MRETSENLPKPFKKSSPGTKNQNPRENFHLTMGPLLKIAKMCLQTRHLLCLQPRHLLCQQTRHLLCQQTSPKTSPRRSPDRGGRFAAAPVWRMWGGCLGRCFLSDTADVLSADTTDVLPADTTHVLPADNPGFLWPRQVCSGRIRKLQPKPQDFCRKNSKT